MLAKPFSWGVQSVFTLATSIPFVICFDVIEESELEESEVEESELEESELEESGDDSSTSLTETVRV